MTTLLLTREQRAQIESAARAAFPRECCGLLEGIRAAGEIRVLEVHATPNAAADVDRFDIDPAEHIRLLRAAREAGREIVGCYHSHPDGRSVPSERDREAAGEDNFIWLIAALKDRLRPIDMKAYVWERDSRFEPLPIASDAGPAGDR